MLIFINHRTTTENKDKEPTDYDDNTSTVLTQSKSWGNRHKVILSDSDDDELESPDNLEITDYNDNTSFQATVPTQSKLWGKQRALLLTDSDDDGLQSPDKLAAIWPMSPSPSATSAAELPPTEYASSTSTASIAEPSDAPEGSELDHKLVDGSLTEPSGVPSVVRPDIDESSMSRRSKRVRIERHISTELGDGSCSEDSCENSTVGQPMVTCAGPGCGLMVSDMLLV